MKSPMMGFFQEPLVCVTWIATRLLFFTRDLGDFLLSHADSTYISVLHLVFVSFSVLKSLADHLTLVISIVIRLSKTRDHRLFKIIK